MPFVLSIDQGTSSTRSIVFNEKGDIVGLAQKPHKQYYPHEAWVEHDASEIRENVLTTMREALEQAKLEWKDITSIGITNQRETVVAWDKKTGNPLHHAIVWQCRRTAPIVHELKQEGYESVFQYKTGLVLDAYFSGTKMKWLLENSDAVRSALNREELMFGTIDSWVIYFLSGEHVTDASNASRTLLYNLQTKSWDEELSEILKVPISTLPEVKKNATTEGFGVFKIDGAEIPIRGVLGDQQAALFGQAAFHPGDVKTTYGTGNFALVNTGNNIRSSNQGLLSTVAWETEDEMNYALEGSVFITGAALLWLKEHLEFFDDYSKVDELASQVKNSGGVYFVPAFVGLGAPYWDSEARGLIIGLTRGTTKAHLVRATLDSIAFQTEDLLDIMKEESLTNIKELRVDGGITRSDILMQRQADISQITVIRPRIIETTALGAALMAGYKEIWETKEELKQVNTPDKQYSPQISKEELEQDLKYWQKAVARARQWIE